MPKVETLSLFYYPHERHAGSYFPMNCDLPISLRESNGAGVLVGSIKEHSRKECSKTLILGKSLRQIEHWDGKTIEKCVEVMLAKIGPFDMKILNYSDGKTNSGQSHFSFHE